MCERKDNIPAWYDSFLDKKTNQRVIRTNGIPDSTRHLYNQNYKEEHYTLNEKNAEKFQSELVCEQREEMRIPNNPGNLPQAIEVGPGLIGIARSGAFFVNYQHYYSGVSTDKDVHAPTDDCYGHTGDIVSSLVI